MKRRLLPGKKQMDRPLVKLSADHGEHAEALRRGPQLAGVPGRVERQPASVLPEETFYAKDPAVSAAVEQRRRLFPQLAPAQRQVEERQRLKARFPAGDGLDVVGKEEAAAAEVCEVVRAECVPVAGKRPSGGFFRRADRIRRPV